MKISKTQESVKEGGNLKNSTDVFENSIFSPRGKKRSGVFKVSDPPSGQIGWKQRGVTRRGQSGPKSEWRKFCLQTPENDEIFGRAARADL